jgi:hypothetical protein
VVSPVLHFKLPEHPEAVKVAFSPSQQIVFDVVIVGAVGLAPFSTTIAFEALLSHSFRIHVAV